MNQPFVTFFPVADIPGLIRGAHENRGLGHSFLRHIERCRCLLYVIDLSVSKPWTQLSDLQYELDQYQPGLSQRPHAIVGNKIDLEDARKNLVAFEDRIKLPVIAISAHFSSNIGPLKEHIRKLYDRDMGGTLNSAKPRTETVVPKPRNRIIWFNDTRIKGATHAYYYYSGAFLQLSIGTQQASDDHTTHLNSSVKPYKIIFFSPTGSLSLSFMYTTTF